MSPVTPVPFSVLDLSPIAQNETATHAFQNTLALARHAEALGFQRFWLAEHHNNPGIASAATSVVIGYVAGGTKTIRVGSGGVMLPNHAPLIIAEQFGTLASLYPNRIDLGLGRAPGTDQFTARALRQDHNTRVNDFPTDVQELQFYFGPITEGQRIQAVPGVGLRVPLWLLGSSLYSAQVAALLGLPFGFASHFAPEYLLQALQIYRERFKASEQINKPYTLVCVNIVAAETDEDAQRLFTSLQLAILSLQRGKPGQWSPPVDNLMDYCNDFEKEGIDRFLKYSFVGSKESIERSLGTFIEQTGADEIMITSHIHDPTARLKSLELVSQISHFKR